MAYENWHVLVDFGTGFTDLTRYVDTVVSPINAGVGDTAETSDEPGRMGIVLNNVDHQFSPGNQLSAMALQTGMPIKLVETIGGFPFELHNGTIEFPEISDLAFPERDQQITVISVDQLSRWERSETFVSTLGAHIMSVGGDNLLGYWPCNDPSGSTVIGSTTVVGPLRAVRTGAASPDLLQLNQIDGPAGEDSSFLTLTPPASGSIVLTGTTSDFVDFVSSDEVSVGLWLRGTGTVNSSATFRSDALTTSIVVSATTTQWQVAVTTGAGSTTVIVTQVPTPDRWSCVSAVLNNLTGAVAMYVDTLSATGTVGAGTSVGQLDTTILAVTGGLTAFAHVQVYGGPVGTWTQARHLAQYRMGLSGLERQTTGERIRTIGSYAGMNDAQMAAVDQGSSVMSRATLSGQTIAEAMYDARNTERGRLFVAGNGALTFHDRRTVLNV